MATATATISYDGLDVKVELIENADGTITATISVLEGFADLNAFYWSNGDEEGAFAGFVKKDSSLNMNGTGEDWDGAEKLSSTGLGSAGTEKATYISADGDSSYTFTLSREGGLTLDDMATIGLRATSTSTDGGSIKAVTDIVISDASNDGEVDTGTDPVVDTGTDTTVVDTGTDTTVVDTGTDTTVVDTGTDTTVVDTGTDTTVVDTGTDTTVVDTGTDTTVVDTGTDTTVVDTGTDTTVVDTGTDTTVVDTGTDTGSGLGGAGGEGGSSYVDLGRVDEGVILDSGFDTSTIGGVVIPVDEPLVVAPTEYGGL